MQICVLSGEVVFCSKFPTGCGMLEKCCLVCHC